jgi:predicted metalloprotease with PDZ domain
MVEYLISWGDPYERLLDVRLRFTAPADEPRLILPSWRPGRYLIQNFAANVRSWSPNMRKEAKAVWRVEGRAGEEVLLTYRYYAGVLDAGSTFLDDDECYVNPSNLLMMVEGLRGKPATLTIAAPADWRIETQLPPLVAPRHPERSEGSQATMHAEENPRCARDDGAYGADGAEGFTLAARDYDHLVDSPLIAASSMTRHTFVEGGARIHLVLRHDQGIDSEGYVEPLRAITRAQASLFGGLPFSEYRFLTHVGDRWHGVEHEESSSLIIKRSAVAGAEPGDEGFDHVLSLCAHELFHAWNVKRIVPACFLPYDYTSETPTRLLWVMEGMTSYFGDLSLVRARVWTEARYLEHLQKEIETLEASPARLHLSLAQASFDAWLQEPAQTHDRQNAWISFYNKGEIVAALLDLALRARTRVSLDDVMLHLWREYGLTGRGLEEDGFERAVTEVSGADFSDFFARYVHGTDALPYETMFALAGITYTAEKRDRLTLGVRFRGEGTMLLDAVYRGGAAMAAGLLPHDELLAIDGSRVTGETDVRRVLASLTEGQAVEILSARNGIVARHSVIPRRDARPSVTLTADGENALREHWLRTQDAESAKIR